MGPVTGDAFISPAQHVAHSVRPRAYPQFRVAQARSQAAFAPFPLKDTALHCECFPARYHSTHLAPSLPIPHGPRLGFGSSSIRTKPFYRRLNPRPCNGKRSNAQRQRA